MKYSPGMNEIFEYFVANIIYSWTFISRIPKPALKIGKQ